MTLQRREDGNERQPTYDEGSEYFTARFHVEGEFVHFPHAIYSGGITHIYDYVELGDLSLLYLDGLCQMAGVYGYKRYYRLEQDGFVLLRTDRALYAYCKEAGGVVDLYVEPDMDMLIQRQWGSPSEWQVDGDNDVDDAAYATTVTEFNRAMNQLVKIDKNAADWLKDKPPAQWSRSHFSVRPKCDMLLNNVSESFNKVLADAREMPILSMFEWIRKYLMVRFQENRERAMMRWQRKGICPKIKKKLQKNIEQAAESIPERADTNKYECHMSDGSQFVVNLADKTCTCRRWELSGIPCAHACSAISMTRKEVEDYVDDLYKVDTYLSVYSLAIEPVSGLKQLIETGNAPVLPPLSKRQPGRPKKARRKSKGEELITKNPKGKQKLRRVGIPCLCSHCKKPGHNKRRCPEIIGSQSTTQQAEFVANNVSHQAKVSRKRKPKSTDPTAKRRSVGNLNENQSPSTQLVAAVQAPIMVQSEQGTTISNAANHNASQVSQTSPNVELSQSTSLPAGLPNFWIKNGKKYVPRSMLQEAMSMMKNKPSGSASK